MYCKAIHALDHVRWQSQQVTYIHKPYSHGFVMGIINMFNLEKTFFIDQFSEKMGKFPKGIDFTHFVLPGQSNQGATLLTKSKTKKGKGAKTESPAVAPKKGGKPNSKQKKASKEETYEPETDMSKPCYFEHLVRLF